MRRRLLSFACSLCMGLAAKWLLYRHAMTFSMFLAESSDDCLIGVSWRCGEENCSRRALTPSQSAAGAGREANHSLTLLEVEDIPFGMKTAVHTRFGLLLPAKILL